LVNSYLHNRPIVYLIANLFFKNTIRAIKASMDLSNKIENTRRKSKEEIGKGAVTQNALRLHVLIDD